MCPFRELGLRLVGDCIKIFITLFNATMLACLFQSEITPGLFHQAARKKFSRSLNIEHIDLEYVPIRQLIRSTFTIYSPAMGLA